LEERRKALRRENDREMQRLVERIAKKPATAVVQERQRRRAIRHSCKAIVTMEIQHAVGGSGAMKSHRHKIPVRVLDLSDGGAAIFSKHPMAHGEVFHMEIKTYDARSIEAKGQVRWSKEKASKGGYAVGVQFTYIDSPSQDRLKTFLSELDANLGM
jgi:c-di-GMP-binding flagellar brake protein YcgR